MIDALISLVKNFSDQDSVKKIRDMLSDLRKTLVDQKNQEQAEEDEHIKEFEDRVAALNKEYAEFQRQVNEATYMLNAYTNKITEQEALIVGRKADLVLLQEQLETENAVFAKETEIYQELRQQYLTDLSIAVKAKEFINSVEFGDYIHSRLNSA
jgi:phosphoglycolate phosphatase-like HAD superfamily hydrolase